MVVDCTSLHGDLLESELFGHEKGAYTGASDTHHGLFEVASGGTVLLDEVGDISPRAQTRLLRVLENGRFRRVGDTREVAVDVRLLAATNRDLQDRMERGYFRRDLYYRLCTLKIHVAPLRERPSDIMVLANHFLEQLCVRFQRRWHFTPGAETALVQWHWPGNVRELLHAVERATIVATDEEIDVEHLPRELRECAKKADDRPQTLAEVEQLHIQRVLKLVGDNRAAAAELLGISERTLYRKVKSIRQTGGED